MKNEIKSTILFSMLFFASHTFFAQETPKTVQEEESSEVFLEEYTDEFQEKFFEGLKQKSIQNYDRAINLFLECKGLDIDNNAVDHELAKTYLLDKKYISAQEYAIEALISEPENYWYLNTLVSILDKQSNTLETIRNTIPYGNTKLKENLAHIYFRKKAYENALQVLENLGNTTFVNNLTQKINDSLTKRDNAKVAKTTVKEVEAGEGDSPLNTYVNDLEEFLGNKEFKKMQKLAMEAIETYPLQPYFYYAHGASLQRTGKSNEAIEALELGLDLLLDDEKLANKFYQELADAYAQLGNTTKANGYLSKIKPGL